MKETNEKTTFPMRGFMVCLHQMNENLPLAGPGPNGIRLILDVMKQAKLNTLLFEYEAYYPWSGKEKIISAANAYSEKDIAEIREYAHRCGIGIIPLVQVFGHLAHVMRHEPFRALAENPDVPYQLCPLRNGSFELACRLIDDTLRLHPDCRFLHLGGDECHQLGNCPECAEYVRKHGAGKLYSSFMGRVTEYVLAKGITPLSTTITKTARDVSRRLLFPPPTKERLPSGSSTLYIISRGFLTIGKAALKFSWGRLFYLTTGSR